jgi:hypothetical protein
VALICKCGRMLVGDTKGSEGYTPFFFFPTPLGSFPFSSFLLLVLQIKRFSSVSDKFHIRKEICYGKVFLLVLQEIVQKKKGEEREMAKKLPLWYLS